MAENPAGPGTVRHLEHLTATGYLVSRQQGVTNLYRLNPGRIDDTFQALKASCQ
jgi:hypothetical protein